MRHLLQVCGVSSLAFFLSLSLSIVETKSQDRIHLRHTLQLPITNHLGTNLVRFKEIIEQESGGRITFEVFDKAQLYKDNEVIDAVSSGKIEMGTVALNKFDSMIPAVNIFGQPFLFNSDTLVREATRPTSAIREPIDNAIRAVVGVEPLWWQPYGTEVIFSKNGLSVASPAAVQGKRVRVLSEAGKQFMGLCGAEGILVSGSKQKEAYETGKVDMGFTGITGVDSRELWQVSDTVTKTHHSVIEFVVIINGKIWRSLSESDRQLITNASLKVEEELRESYAAIEETAYKFATEKEMRIVELGPNDVADWRVCSADMLFDFLNTAGELGQRMMDAYGKLRMDPCCNEGPAGIFTRR